MKALGVFLAAVVMILVTIDYCRDRKRNHVTALELNTKEDTEFDAYLTEHVEQCKAKTQEADKDDIVEFIANAVEMHESDEKECEDCTILYDGDRNLIIIPMRTMTAIVNHNHEVIEQVMEFTELHPDADVMIGGTVKKVS